MKSLYKSGKKWYKRSDIVFQKGRKRRMNQKRRALIIRITAAIMAILMIASVFSAVIFR